MKLNRRVTIITRFSGIMFSLLLLGGLAACSDDNNGNDTPEPEPSTYPTTPFSKIELKEVLRQITQYHINAFIWNIFHQFKAIAL